MKLVSFNVNGLRSRLHQLAALVEKHRPDIIGLQETKKGSPRSKVGKAVAGPRSKVQGPRSKVGKAVQVLRRGHETNGR
jgi:exonuclease III